MFLQRIYNEWRRIIEVVSILLASLVSPAISGGVFLASLDFSISHGCLEVLKNNVVLEVNLPDFALRRLGGTSGASRCLRTNVIDLMMSSGVTTRK